MHGSWLAFVLAFMSFVIPTMADDDADRIAKYREIISSLKYQHGDITVGDDLAKLSVPENFAFLDAKAAEKVLTDLWGNPPDPSVLGLIVPKTFNPVAENSWAVVISYEESGYVKDSDADKINYDQLLKEMQKSSQEANEERQKEGYPTIQLIGWAEPPRYDKTANKLYWAKELEFNGDPERTLNYNIRVLGRKGVLVLNAVASMKQLPEIQAEMPTVISMVNFKDGHRYADFDPKIDKVAEYGLAALVAGGIAAKTGLLKTLLIGLLAAKKFLIAGAAAAVAFFAKFFRRKS